MQHLDEGTIHAWLDGQLPAEKADEIAAHASKCPDCAATIAEARGLVAASTRILTALDNVSVGVTPLPSEGLSVPIRRRRWYDRTDIRVAAALLFVAGASLVVVRGGQVRESTSSRAMRSMADTSKAVADALSPSTKPSADETRQLNAPAVGVRARESGMMKSAPVPPAVAQAAAPALLQAEAGARRAPATGTAFAKKSIGSVEGRVFARDSGKGLTGASVNVLGTPIGATTDTAGRFKIENVPAGQQRVAVRRIGYATQSIPLVVDSGSTANAQVALAASPTALEELVVTSVGAKVDVAAAPLRVQRTDSSASTTRIIYQVSPGVEVTLTESRVDTGVNRAMAVADSASVPLNTISWTDRGRRYTLTGRLTKTELEILKTRLIAMRR